MKVVTLPDAKVRISRILRRVVGGEHAFIGRAAVPAVRLVSIMRRGTPRPGLASGRLTEAFFEPLPADELAAWQQ
jgi:antitoxin (DNA-binding transcriptional repressor) of toxin-antitoxin stability system